MPAYTMPGLMTGQNTNEIIKKLVELERRPVKRWETENEYAKAQVQVWNEVKNLTANLQTKTRAITSFTAPFATKSVLSSTEGVITGEASRAAKSAERPIEILELASKHQISGVEVDSDVRLPAGSFSIFSGKHSETIQFAGGSLSDLTTSIRNAASSIADATVIKVDKDSSLLTVLAVKTGKLNALQFSDPNGILHLAGLVGENSKEGEIERRSLVLSQEKALPFEPTKFKASSQEGSAPKKSPEGFSFAPDSAFSFETEAIEIKSRSYIEFNPVGETNQVLELGFVFEREGNLRTKLFPIALKDGKYQLQIGELAEGKTLKRIIIANSGASDVQISQIEMVIPPKPGTAEPKKTLQEAKDARFKIDGVELSRESNEGITDVLEGISFNMHKVTTEPVTLKIAVDHQKGMALVKEWVQAYNDLMKFTKEVTSVDKNSKLSDSKPSDNSKDLDISKEFWDNKVKSGILAGENALIRLIASMKTVANSYYPATKSGGYRVLTDIGISTGEVGSNWEKIQDGVLVINEERLTQALSENPDGLRELFASDMNNDAKMEDGVGIRLLETLRPYTQYSSGIISSKIKLIEENVASNNKKIKEFESHLVGYEAKLKQRFLYMEQGVGKNKSVGNYLQNNMFRGNGQE
ncbi:flagellar hook-associated protein FliD [Leptospira ryugenii]|uniref:Flagellar hook-associated protein 2 n=1 Tax=Leptospira ryugenii TaxID=1917863 RepID=A0A2P2DZY9_9LEPT|nr:flagellar filament capping protein FliD [Leptospira ryugenii]GBF50201.1 flagellar hook-associated protein FliD [Leptospira ryugenii]